MNPPDHRPFEEPWQAQAFALTVALHENGLFSWTQWAEQLSARLYQPDASVDGSDYYQRWLLALEDIVVAKHAASPEEVRQLTAAWQRAAHATPHGSPIRLENDPEARLTNPVD